MVDDLSVIEQAESTGEPATGYLADYISGQFVRDTPEEREAVQVMARRLVEDFGYPKQVITTRPQFRVRRRPSDTGRSYPVDIAVFPDPRKLEDGAFILVECKRKTRNDGEKQLKIYLTMSAARIGVWFNGKDHLYLMKTNLKDGSIDWKELPSLPKYGQSIADIGSLRRSQLTKPGNLKAVFRDIRNHLAGNTTGITRDQQLAQEIMSLLFCKIYDELNTKRDDLPRFRVSLEEAPNRVQKRVKELFSDVKAEYADVFGSSDTIALDKDSLTYVVGELQTYAVTEAARDAVGDAFEVFIGPAVRGEEGQFFTPRNVVQLLVDLVDPRPNERILDPACGSGGFLIVALQHMWRQVEAEGKAKSWSDVQLDRRKGEIARKSIRGLDKDAFLIKLTKAYLAIIGDGRSGVFCEDTLAPPDKWQNDEGAAAVPLAKFDVILTNPPFGSKIKVVGQHKLSQFELGHRWIKERKTDEWMRTDSVEKHQPPQVLFIERCVQFLKPGGRLGMVLPESIFGMPKYGYIVQWLMRNFTLKAFISLPEEVFQPSTHAKTCLLLLKNTPPPEDYTIHMAIADWCGHDSRGNDTLRPNSAGELVLMDDLPKISSELHTKIVWSDGD